MTGAFNYISFGNRDAIPEDDGRISMSRRRMFEYTPDPIAAALQGLTESALTYLERLPTFLCSEIDRRDGGAFLRVKYGRVSDVTLDNGDVAAVFNQEIDFGNVAFPDPDAAREVLQAGSYQLYRTHWAVREGDVAAILHALGQWLPEPPQDAALPPDEAAEPPAAPDRQTLGEANSVGSFLNYLFEAAPGGTSETFFEVTTTEPSTSHRPFSGRTRTGNGGTFRMRIGSARSC